MGSIPRPLLLVELSSEAAALVGALPANRYFPQPVSCDDLPVALSRAKPNSMMIVEPIDPGSATATFGKVASTLSLLERKVRIPIVAVLRHPENDSELVGALLEAGLTEWIDLAREGSVAAVDRRLRYAAAVTVQRLLARALPNPMSSRAHRLLGVAMEVVAEGGQAPELAAALGIAERTLSGWCARADLPPPRRLLAWLRLLIVADHLDDGRSTLESIARASGYSSGASLKTALRNLLDATPRELRERGAFTTIADRFRTELRARREAGHARRRPPKTWLS